MLASASAVHEGQALSELRAKAGEVGPLRGRMIGRFTGGFYAQVDGQIFAAAGPGIWPGPIHLVADRIPEPSLDEGEMGLTATALHYPGGVIDMAPGSSYSPPLPTAAALKAAAARLARWGATAPAPDDLTSCWHGTKAAVRQGDIRGAGDILQGRGTGLTPSGDDVLAGLLLFARWSGSSEASLAPIAAGALTTDLSRSFLRWAARGQSIAPVHALVLDDPIKSAAEREARFARAAEVVCRIGHRSGSALMIGLGLAAATWIDGDRST